LGRWLAGNRGDVLISDHAGRTRRCKRCFSHAASVEGSGGASDRRALDLTDEISVKILPQSARFDVRVHAGKWRFH
jgi:hypothetical protein